MKIHTNISNEFEETTIIINTSHLTSEIQDIINYLSNTTTKINQIIAYKNYEIYFIDLDNIICFFSREKNNYIRTSTGIFKIKYKLYEIEKLFSNKDFIRISKSCIINMNQVECFDTSILGTIIVKFKDKSKENVSKRNVSQITKILKERRKRL